MSDKFFFKGRQDARQSHINHGYNTEPNKILGSKKYPLTLVVTNEARKTEIAQQVNDAKLYANITVDNKVDAKEQILELTIILNKANSVTVEKTPNRNEPCICGSGKKYKKCCG